MMMISPFTLYKGSPSYTSNTNISAILFLLSAPHIYMYRLYQPIHATCFKLKGGISVFLNYVFIRPKSDHCLALSIHRPTD